MAVEDALNWLQDLNFPTEIRESVWLFPTIETVHVFALVLVVGSIMTVDLRLLGLTNRERPFSEIAAEMLAVDLGGFYRRSERRLVDVFIQGAHLLRQYSVPAENVLLAASRDQHGAVSLVRNAPS